MNTAVYMPKPTNVNTLLPKISANGGNTMQAMN
jgi:hypothetical protein